MIELDSIKIALIMGKEAADRLTARILASGVPPSNILAVEPHRWRHVARYEPRLCFWDFADLHSDAPDTFAPNPPRPMLPYCLNVRIVADPHPEISAYDLSWQELDTPEAEEKLQQLIAEAEILYNHRVGEKWYRLAVMEGNIGLWWWDRELNFVYLSEHFQQMLGLSADDLPSDAQQWTEMIHSSDRPGLLVAIENQFQKQTGRFRYECRIRQGDGTYRWYTLSGHCQHEMEGRARVHGAAIDITEKKQAELQLAHAKQQAEVASRAKTEFLTNMSHNLRTPLTAVLGFAEMLNDFFPDRNARDAIQSIQENSQHLMRLLDDILELSGVDIDLPASKFSKTSMEELLRDIVETFHIKALNKGLEFTVTTDPQVPETLFANASRIRQVLGRLIDNAIKFTEQGEVSIEVNYLPGPAPTLEFLVMDTGIGIPRDRIREIFEPFSQGDNSTSRDHGGSGLGLSLCQRQTRILKGSLTVESEVGIGSRFELRVPIELTTAAKPKDASENPTPEKPQLPRLDGYRFLLVEDGIDNQRLIKALLQKAGATVDVAENGQIAVDWIEAHHRPDNDQAESDPDVDVILMDMQMPVLDGYQATQILRERGFNKPIVALTAHALQGDRQRCLDAGCDDYFTKPITRQTLLEAAHQYAQQAARHTAEVVTAG